MKYENSVEKIKLSHKTILTLVSHKYFKLTKIAQVYDAPDQALVDADETLAATKM